MVLCSMVIISRVGEYLFDEALFLLPGVKSIYTPIVSDLLS